MGKEVKIGVAVILVLLAVLGALVAHRLMPGSRGEPAAVGADASDATEQAAAGTTFERPSEDRPLTTAMKPAVVELKESTPRGSAGLPPEPRQWTIASDASASGAAGATANDAPATGPSYMPRPPRAETSTAADRYGNAYPLVEGPVMAGDPYPAGSTAAWPTASQHVPPDGGLRLLDPSPSDGASGGLRGGASVSAGPAEARSPHSQSSSPPFGQSVAPPSAQSPWPPQTQSGRWDDRPASQPAATPPPAPQPEPFSARGAYTNRNSATADAWNSRVAPSADGAGGYRTAPAAGPYGSPGAAPVTAGSAAADSRAGDSYLNRNSTATYPRQPDSLSVAPAGLGRSVAAQPAACSGYRGDGTYEVQPNDSYWTISEKVYGTGAYFKALAEHNRTKAPREEQLAVGQIIATPEAATLHSQYPDLCPKPDRVEAQLAQTQAAAAPRGYAFGRVYTVEEGDTLFSIARHELGKASRWVEIYELNRNVLGADHDYLRPGLQLVLPDDNNAPGPVTQRLGPDAPYRR